WRRSGCCAGQRFVIRKSERSAIEYPRNVCCTSTHDTAERAPESPLRRRCRIASRRARGYHVTRSRPAEEGSLKSLLLFPRNSTMRFLHTMLRVGNLERSLAFYTEVLEMRLLRTS